MTKNELIDTFKAGFVVGDDDYPDNLLVNKKRTTDAKLALDMYDANLMGVDFHHCNKKYQEKIISQLGNNDDIRTIRSQGVAIDIDDKIILKGK